MNKIYLLSHSHRHGDDAYLVVTNGEFLDPLDLYITDPDIFEISREDEYIAIETVGDAVEAAILASEEAVSQLLRYDIISDELRKEVFSKMDEWDKSAILDRHMLRDENLLTTEKELATL